MGLAMAKHKCSISRAQPGFSLEIFSSVNSPDTFECERVSFLSASFLWDQKSHAPMYMMVDSSPMRIWGRSSGQFLHAGWWLWSLVLGAQTLLHFGQAQVGAEEDWDAARSFRLLRLSFAASRLSASNLRLAFLTDERQLSQSEAACCHD